MKQNFKRIICTALALCLLCVTALAAAPTEAGVYDVQGLTPKTAADGAITAERATIDNAEKDFYPLAERFDLSISATANEQCLVFLLKDGAADKMPLPTKDNIYYIDQKTGAATVSFNLFPMTLASGDYTVWLTRTGTSAAENVGSFRYYQSYMLGDVNSDKIVDVLDATQILQAVVNNEAFSGSQLRAADTNHDEIVDVLDATQILQAVVNNEELK